MKEYDYSKWDNHPREMWVWDDDESKKVKQFVIFYNKECTDEYSVITVRHNDIIRRKHCAEIEQTRRMTNYELSRWLWEGAQFDEFREMIDGMGYITCNNDYEVSEESITVSEDIKIRINGGEWKVPLIEE